MSDAEKFGNNNNNNNKNNFIDPYTWENLS